MPNDIVQSQGCDEDIAAINEGKMVLLHRWAGGHILLMGYDPHMPDWTTTAERPSAEEIEERVFGFEPARAEKYATGYVFRVFEENSAGHIVVDGKNYAELEIYDYVIWTDEQQVRQKYHEVVVRARSEE